MPPGRASGTTLRRTKRTSEAIVLGRFAATLAVICAVVGCQAKAPQRPTKVPASAIWAGGPDGGSWIDCAKEDSGTTYSCTVYNDSSGDVEAQGKYRLQGLPAAPAQLKFTGFDGEVILLAQGRLEPAK